MNRVGVLLVWLVAAAGLAAAASPDPKALAVPPAELAKARTLVGKLGSEAFDEREEAQEQLAKMGRLALPALTAGLTGDPSPEVRFRCQALLPKAAAEDLQARMAAFLADADGKYDHDLPGWTEFHKLAGNAPAARPVFAELLADAANRELVLAATGPPATLGGLVADRRQELYYQRFPRVPNATRKDPSAADVTALLFADSLVAAKHVPRTISTTAVYTTPGFMAAVADAGERGAVYKAVVARWITTRDDAATLYQAIGLATTLGLTADASAAAARLFETKTAPPSYRAMAAFTLARNGAKDRAAVLEAAFADEGVVMTRRVFVAGVQEAHELQVRDVALAAALLATGQEPDAYGFTDQYKNQSGMRFQYTNWQVAADKRAAAFDQWKAWRAKNPDAKK